MKALAAGCGRGGRRRGPACAAALALVAALAGCGRDESPALAPQAGSPPSIEEVHPAARSTGVFYETDIWVRFAVPLDPASVNERTVFLKLDTVRIPVTVTYDAASRTIRLVPRQLLALLRTHTVEITPAVATPDGASWGPTYFWQFKTNGLRRPADPVPAAGTTYESPFALLKWAPTEPSAGTILYEVHVGADSSAVAARSGPPTRVVTAPYFLPNGSWGLDRRVHWAVTAINQTTGERLAGPVWSFGTLPPGLPVDSVSVAADHWGWFHFLQNRLSCSGGMASGPSYNGGIHWRLREDAAGLKLARAQLVTVTSNTNLTAIRPVVRPVFDSWLPCSYSAITPKVTYTDLAAGVQIATLPRFSFESDAFTAYLEASARHGVVYGYSLGSAVDASWNSGPAVTLVYYRVPTAPAVAPAP